MNQEPCPHSRMEDIKMGRITKSICPDCGFEAFTSNEEIEEATQEVADRIENEGDQE